MVIIILLFSIGALNSGMYLNEIKVQDNALNHPSDNKINVSLSIPKCLQQSLFPKHAPTDSQGHITRRNARNTLRDGFFRGPKCRKYYVFGRAFKAVLLQKLVFRPRFDSNGFTLLSHFHCPILSWRLPSHPDLFQQQEKLISIYVTS